MAVDKRLKLIADGLFEGAEGAAELKEYARGCLGNMVEAAALYKITANWAWPESEVKRQHHAARLIQGAVRAHLVCESSEPDHCREAGAVVGREWSVGGEEGTGGAGNES